MSRNMLSVLMGAMKLLEKFVFGYFCWQIWLIPVEIEKYNFTRNIKTFHL